MLDEARIAVVVPAHDEEPWLAEVLDTLPDFVDLVVVVDDGSRDGTARVATSWGAASGRGRPALTLVRHRGRRGVGAAIVSGYREARRSGIDVVAVMAGDGQMHPDDLRAVVQPVVDGRADYVKGNRLDHGLVRSVMPRGRRLGTLVLSHLTRLVAGVPVRDSQCGYTAIAGATLDQLALETLWPGFGYPNDLIGALARCRARIEEVVVRPVYRGENSALRPWHAATIGYVLVRTAWRRARAHAEGAASA
ncbi:MAG: glycosyltransferase family 2 protein [Deltaproteobacteria bacterium]|nr:glycosyltransferase family 2 protein [Deltaproteobacteria bacterium]MBW2536049.1 glycosyltransferase family 2 protein [Deltaproteobacteria bacterium]